ncbi:MAG: MGMT family protein [Actinomycetota bacterium]|nr:MGMT family protein [Actinomycetota bacterium]
MLSVYALRVLAVVERIPAGRVMSYGDVCEYLGESSARAVGAVLATAGSEVAWHRVVMASGSPAPQHADEQLALLRAEGVALTARGDRVDMPAARWDGR